MRLIVIFRLSPVIIFLFVNLSFSELDPEKYCLRPGTKRNYYCCKGYIKRNGRCVANCEEVCENSYCARPNYCECKPGYRRLSNTRCIPNCSSCDHGHCVAPEICNCYPNYRKSVNGSCVPECSTECINGECIEPNTCQCLEGFTEKNNFECEIMTTTTEQMMDSTTEESVPEYYETEEREHSVEATSIDYGSGFEEQPQLFLSNLQQEIEPTEAADACDLDCVNGYCVGNNTCLCYDNYRVSEAYSNVCEAICEFGEDNQTCINSDCVMPNVCECHENYQRVSAFECHPICSNCTNAICIAPELCQCVKGYHEVTKNVCEPECIPNCQNSICIEPNVCQCFEEYEKVSNFECVPKNQFVERENCLKFCKNGECNADNQCICGTGFKLRDGVCRKVCDLHCDNGECLDDQCFCNSGYRNSAENSTFCSPICAFELEGHDCINGHCIAPNTCQCFDGFEFLGNMTCTCTPICEVPCVNATCVNPNICECFADLIPLNNSYCVSKEFLEAQKQCEDSCTNGKCSSTNQCICDSGYKLNSNRTCEKICDLNCINSYCEDQKCHCFPNFQKSQTNSTKCDPICESSCINGFCSAPNQCECNHGYIRVNSTFCISSEEFYDARELCQRNCLNGFCMESNECECFNGYKRVDSGDVPFCERIEVELALFGFKSFQDLLILTLAVCVIIMGFIICILIYMQRYASTDYMIADKENSDKCVYFLKKSNEVTIESKLL